MAARAIRLRVEREVARPPGVILAMHLCRGSNRSHCYAEGGYDAIVEKLFGTMAVDKLRLVAETARRLWC